MKKLWTDQGGDDYIYWQTQDRKVLKRLNDLIKDIERNGYNVGIGKPEPLKIIYQVGGHVVLIKKIELFIVLKTGNLKLLNAEDIIN